MQRKLDVLLWEARKYVRSILSRTADETLAGYSANGDLRLVIEREFTILGEVLVRIREDFPAEFGRIIEAQQIVRFRNRLVHLYDLMQDEEVWRVITVWLPQILRQVDKLMEEQQP